MSDHVVPVRIYGAVFTALLVLTAITIRVAFMDLGKPDSIRWITDKP